MPDPKARRPARRTAKPKRKRPSDPARRRAIVWGAAASVVFVGLLFAFVYPTRTFIDQRTDTAKARDQLAFLRDANAKLADEAKLLQGDDEIKKRARAYGLVEPGERPFVIIPAPATPTTTTAPPDTKTSANTGTSANTAPPAGSSYRSP